MKRLYTTIIISLLIVGGLWAKPSFSAGIGGDFFNYEQSFLDMGTSVIIPIEQGMEINLGIDFSIATEKSEAGLNAIFYVPLDIGLNFVFNEESKLQYLVGVGLSPQFLFADEFNLYIGPYAEVGLRVRVHDYMKWYLEVKQDLVIGAPNWINTATRLKTGIIFSFESPEINSPEVEESN